jgi:hypothetical protein
VADDERHYADQLDAALGSREQTRKLYEQCAAASADFERVLEFVRPPVDSTEPHVRLTEAVKQYRQLMSDLAGAIASDDLERVAALHEDQKPVLATVRACAHELFPEASAGTVQR